jgi:acyl carrier protein
VFDDPNLELRDDLSRGDWVAWDSLAHVKLVLALEEEFGVKLSFDQVANIRSVADLKRIIAN